MTGFTSCFAAAKGDLYMQGWLLCPVKPGNEDTENANIGDRTISVAFKTPLVTVIKKGPRDSHKDLKGCAILRSR